MSLERLDLSSNCIERIGEARDTSLITFPPWKWGVIGATVSGVQNSLSIAVRLYRRVHGFLPRFSTERLRDGKTSRFSDLVALQNPAFVETLL